MHKEDVSVIWFRRDLRLSDNLALSEALKGDYPVLPLFIFDEDITDELPANDPRINFIHSQLKLLATFLFEYDSSIYCKKGKTKNVWQELMTIYNIKTVYANEDYEPYAKQRDEEIDQLLAAYGSKLQLFKDQVIFAKDEVLKADNKPYTVYTPYKNKWLSNFNNSMLEAYKWSENPKFFKLSYSIPSLESMGFKSSSILVKDYDISKLDEYEAQRNFPGTDKTSYLSPHLRFGTISVRHILAQTKQHETFRNELIWREFFMQILHHFPKVVNSNFKSKYDRIPWRNNELEFEKWKAGRTGYPMVDAGMRQLNATGYMHNRVRMVVAGFLCKHLLIDWRWGEAYFAEKLLDYELSSNNGNWQWAAGTGCDAAPYFRVFNPTEQVKKFDKDLNYIKKWVPELETLQYPPPMVDHKMARLRAINTYKTALL